MTGTYRFYQKKSEKQLLPMLPDVLSSILAASGVKENELFEIRLRVGKGLRLDTAEGELLLTGQGKRTKEERDAFIIEAELIKETLLFLTDYSAYSFEDELRQGFFTIRGGHRIGVAGQAVAEEKGVSRMSYITFMNIRIAHECFNCAKPVFQKLTSGKEPLSALVLSPPGCGKTTFLRDICRLFSENGFTVGLADERSELSASYLGVPQLSVGERTDVITGCDKAEAMKMLLRSMTPKLLIADEIFTKEDVKAIRTAASSGCKVIASAHAGNLQDLIKNPELKVLFEEYFFDRFVFLSRKQNLFSVSGLFDSGGKEIALWNG